MAMAHLLELPNKMKLSHHDYLTVQQIYRGWALVGIVVTIALAATAILTVMHYRQGEGYGLPLAAFFCLFATQLIFWFFTYPVNRATANWSTLPDNWLLLRNQWEFSHAAGALLHLAALIILILSVLKEFK